jgi:hypothetical protein
VAMTKGVHFCCLLHSTAAPSVLCTVNKSHDCRASQSQGKLTVEARKPDEQSGGKCWN